MVSTSFRFELTKEQEERAREIWRSSIVFDGCLLGGNFEYPECTAEFMEGGITGGSVTVADARHDFTQGLDSVFRYRKLVEENPDKFLLAVSPQDIERAKRTGRMAAVLAFQDSKPIGDNLDRLQVFYDLGVRVIQITYNTQNFVGSGCIERHYGGLTYFGLDLVREMNRLGIAIDLSHTSDETSWDAIRASEKPVFFTHANARAICPAVGRNKPDDLVRALAEKGGVIGVIFRPNFIKRDADHRPLLCTVNDLLDHVDHLVNLVGVDHVGFGSDVFSRMQVPGTRMSPWLVRFRQLRPDVFGRSEFWSTCEGLEDGRSFVNLARGLVARGYGDGDVRKILGGNFLHALRIAWNLHEDDEVADAMVAGTA